MGGLLASAGSGGAAGAPPGASRATVFKGRVMAPQGRRIRPGGALGTTGPARPEERCECLRPARAPHVRIDTPSQAGVPHAPRVCPRNTCEL